MKVVNVPSYPSPGAEEASVIYAVGDIHGRLDLLISIEEVIADDLAKSNAGKAIVCYLGDYIDRGPQSAQVVDQLLQNSSLGAAKIFLRGNHEDRLLDFLSDPASNAAAFLSLGGRATLSSYGVAFEEIVKLNDWQMLRDHLLSAMPAGHLEFFKALRLAFVWKEYLFVHAGVHPDNPLEAQYARDLIWIREPFLSSEKRWDYRVVHGHVIVPYPDFRSNRIGIDTGAEKTGKLTCLVISKNECRILQVTANNLAPAPSNSPSSPQ